MSLTIIIIVKAASAIEVQRSNISAGIITPARPYALHREESRFLLLCTLHTQRPPG